MCIPMEEEIRSIVFSFEGNKVSGLDGFPMFFFQSFWDIIAKDVVEATKEFFGSGNILKELNSSFIVLMPKKLSAASFDEFRSISLCNSIYKIFSKVLAVRLQKVLPLIISPQQNGFVASRKILDSILTIHENIHSLIVNKRASFILKLDLLKAYDRVDWGFLSKILKAFGFGEKIMVLINQLISTLRFFVLVNVSPSPLFDCSRGPRQGDPISPFLFIIMVESLGHLIQRFINSGLLFGLAPSSSNLICSH